MRANKNALVPYGILEEENDVIILRRHWACLLGDRESLFLSQVHYWLRKNEERGHNIRDGRVWVYNSLPSWIETDFPFWTVQNLRTVIRNLTEAGVLVIGNYNQLKMDKTAWYSIDYDRLLELKKKGSARCVEINTSSVDSNRPIPETTTETTKGRCYDGLEGVVANLRPGGGVDENGIQTQSENQSPTSYTVNLGDGEVVKVFDPKQARTQRTRARKGKGLYRTLSKTWLSDGRLVIHSKVKKVQNQDKENLDQDTGRTSIPHTPTTFNDGWCAAA